MKTPKIFLIHGLFLHGTVMLYQKKQLEKLGYDVHVFSYKTVGNSMEENAGLLVDYVRQHREVGDECHFVGHSLGGLLIRLTYDIAPELFTGKIVTMGTPHNGSIVAKRIAEDLHRAILGGSYEDALDGDLPDWDGGVPLGSIAGTRCIGVGMALHDLKKPNDGTVSVTETELDGQTDHCCLDLSHTALVYSSRVVEKIDIFLQKGAFLHNENQDDA